MTRAILLTGLLALTGWLALGASAATYTITITGITPRTINPRANESSRITYRVPTALRDFTITVADSANIPVRTLANYRMLSSGTYSITWNGRNSTGATVPNGDYTVTIVGNRAGSTVLPGVASVTVQSAPVTYPLTITSVTGIALDPANGERLGITCSTPVALAVLSASVLNDAGVAVRELTTMTNLPAGRLTVYWDGRDDADDIVADGVYTITFDGQTSGSDTILPATLALRVASGPAPPEAVGDKGNLLEGLFAANYPNMRYAGIRFGVAFVAPHTGTLNQITMQWKSSRGYGAGTGGRYTFELQTNGPDNFPSGTVIGRTANVDARTAMDRYIDGAFHFPITADLTAGTIYHLVVTNVDRNAYNNWASPNTMAVRVLPWTPENIGGIVNGRALSFYVGRWTPWTAPENPWSAGDYMVNGCHVPVLLSWTDGVDTGDPYYCALSQETFAAHIYGTRQFGEVITWTDTDTVISRVGFPVYKVGAPAGDLRYHLDEVGGTALATGVVTTAAAAGTQQAWRYATLAQPVMLTTGHTYRLWLDASVGTNAANYYQQRIPYGESRPAAWLACGWGGTASHYSYNIGRGWTDWLNADLSFSLR